MTVAIGAPVAFRGVTYDKLYCFVGSTSVKYIPVNETVDANKVKFVLPLKAREKRQFSYDLTASFRSNVTR